jgi:hypothetical protein
VNIKKENGDLKTEASYPIYDLAEAVKVAEGVRDLGGGNVPIARSLLAKHLKYAETGPSYFQRIAAAKAFGIIEGRGSYGLTDLGREYFYPTIENGQKVAAVKLLTFPNAFAGLVGKFDGAKLPTIEMLGNIIHTEADIPVSKKNAVAGCFIRSANFIGVIDAGGVLRCKAIMAAEESAAGNQPNQPAAESPASGAIKLPPGVPEIFSTLEENSLYLYKEKKNKVTLKCPLFLSKADYDRICNWIKATWIIEEEKKSE